MSWHSDENQEERQLVDNKSQNNLDICFIVLVHGVSKNVLEMINCVVSIMCSHEDSAENCKNRYTYHYILQNQCQTFPLS